ncbi:glycoside hydrolase family 32 protein [Mucilaginibacter segetis]|uniref:Glycoside hydrolase family 32 protein n=1 Tax=Mucilaginibacter segetis TaxID=2793071 RepID=A0A934PW19_9SPHI|nr:glycoside hydrolase family 32 protein [Mucilaginibacter segetis]MBK0380712.1 glycoside hydrolase family 32 protein [Mucilaginibacter segetis]
MNLLKLPLIGCLMLAAGAVCSQTPAKVYHEGYRPQVHFSPKAKWTNDPNGLVFYKGTYHLFFQHYPDDIVWGPMHWGHAVSTDLIHWKQMPIALYPDKLGYIFSGSVVVDENNTSGFGKNGQTPLVAIFTHHDPEGEKSGSNTFQNESLAYSLDAGQTWTKYAANPVLKNPGIKDFRDPKVFWYAPQHKWVMSLATKDRITFYSSKNLKNWTKESEFGKTVGAHGGVWECPDLISLQLNGKQYWVLLVSINPGGENGGSATQYFVGEFNGHTFTPVSTNTKWIDYGPDDYAGVTWSNTGNRKIFLGWMSNWIYANQVPTKTWRNAMTIPRELSLKQVGSDIFLTGTPVKELGRIASKSLRINPATAKLPAQYTLKFDVTKINDYSLEFSNDAGEKLIIGYDRQKSRYYIDRSRSGEIAFNKEFVNMAYAPRLSASSTSTVELVMDASSVELFADGGLTIMTGIFFPSKTYTHLKVVSNQADIKNMVLTPLSSIW